MLARAVEANAVKARTLGARIAVACTVLACTVLARTVLASAALTEAGRSWLRIRLGPVILVGRAVAAGQRGARPGGRLAVGLLAVGLLTVAEAVLRVAGRLEYGSRISLGLIVQVRPAGV